MSEDRRTIIFESLKEQYPEIGDGALDAVSEAIDHSWDILRKRSLDGENGDWTLSGQIQNVIWDTFGGGGQSASVAHRILQRMSEKGLK